MAELGYRTYVVDPDTLGGKYGNEWDFVDYGPWGIETIRAGMEDEVFDAGSLDVAVSVSVIEHLPAAARREGLRQIFAALRPGGLAVLSVDLIPGAESYLWNLIVDEVEPLRRHGTFDDLKSECRQAGFVIAQVERCPISLPELRVEALILHRP